MTSLRISGLLVVALSAVALAGSPAQAQPGETRTWTCYVAADSITPKGVVISQLFEWTGVGGPPQNVMGSQFQKLAKPLMPSANWPISSCGKNHGQVAGYRSDRISGMNRVGGTVVHVDYEYRGP